MTIMKMWAVVSYGELLGLYPTEQAAWKAWFMTSTVDSRVSVQHVDVEIKGLVLDRDAEGATAGSKP